MQLYAIISFFGTNLLTQCPVRVADFCLFRKSLSKRVQTRKNFGLIFSGLEETQESSGEDQKSHDEVTILEGPRGVSMPPGLWAPRGTS